MPSPRKHPRVSVNDLALYMVSSETARMTIIRRAKERPTYIATRYKDARNTICSFLADPTRNLSHLVTAEQMLDQRSKDASESCLRQDDARQSIEVLHAIQGMQNTLGKHAFSRAPASQATLHMASVEVSVRADLLVHGRARGIDQIGAAVLRMTKDDATTSAARQRRENMGRYAATLILMHVEQNIPSNRTPASRLCLSVDIQHGRVFAAPRSNSRRIGDLNNACKVIAAMWNQI